MRRCVVFCGLCGAARSAEAISCLSRYQTGQIRYRVDGGSRPDLGVRGFQPPRPGPGRLDRWQKCFPAVVPGL